MVEFVHGKGQVYPVHPGIVALDFLSLADDTLYVISIILVFRGTTKIFAALFLLHKTPL